MAAKTTKPAAPKVHTITPITKVSYPGPALAKNHFSVGEFINGVRVGQIRRALGNYVALSHQHQALKSVKDGPGVTAEYGKPFTIQPKPAAPRIASGAISESA